MRPRSASAIGLWRVSWMNAGADYGLRRGRRGWRRTRSAGAYGSLRRGNGPVRGARRSRRPIRHCVRTWSGWWIPRAVATRSRPCGGRPRVCGAYAMSCAPGPSGLARDRGAPVAGVGYSLQANRKVREGTTHPDRDAQFQHLNTTATRALDAGEPVISVDTKKKELVGDAQERRTGMAPQGLTRAGPGARLQGPGARQGNSLWHLSAWRPKKAGCRSASTMTQPSLRSTLSAVSGSTSAGSAPRTPARLTVTADCGGANGYRTRLWKVELQHLADETGLAIQVCPFPPGTSNWRGKPLTELATIVNLIASTRHPQRSLGLCSTRRGQLPRQGHGLGCRGGSREPARTRLPPRLE